MNNNFVLMAQYNEWMNAKIYATAGELSEADLAAPRGAFFGSILGTLNHIVVGDRIWLRRFAAHPSGYSALAPMIDLQPPSALSQILYTDLNELAEHRKWLDQIILDWAGSISDRDQNHILRYTTTKGIANAKRFGDLVIHFFNHQTHHRGQVTTLLHQAGNDVGVTDLLMLIPNAQSA